MTLEEIMLRTKDCCGCNLWTGGTNGNGLPKVSQNGSLRRFVYSHHFGQIKGNSRVTLTCESSLCLNPEHMKLSTVSSISKKSLARPDVKAKRRVNGMRLRLAAKLTMEIADQIRARTETNPVLAKEFGVSRSLVQKVRAYKAWVPHTSPFAGLMR